MSKKRMQYSTEFKAKIALAAIRGEETVPQLAARYHIHPTQINSWKRHLIEKASDLFGKNSDANNKNKTSAQPRKFAVIMGEMSK
ncbi:Helix-turn-helix domain-containing protein [Nitrosomonas cryotolerans]|uniref:Helix-turn-helix domain-containing protein n=1 Tax=Nitrosomonas cryotolerans ATCC 49181 TaxID=1131553 RepID=A0A1N6J910_9PROT